MVEKKDYQKEEVFEGFEESKNFLKQHTVLRKNEELIDPKRKNKGIHYLPIKCLKSSNDDDLPFPKLIGWYIEETGKYFDKHGSLNKDQLYQKPLPHGNLTSDVNTVLRSKQRQIGM